MKTRPIRHAVGWPDTYWNELMMMITHHRFRTLILLAMHWGVTSTDLYEANSETMILSVPRIFQDTQPSSLDITRVSHVNRGHWLSTAILYLECQGDSLNYQDDVHKLGNTVDKHNSACEGKHRAPKDRRLINIQLFVTRCASTE